MANVCSALIANVLKDLGYDVPSEDELEDLIQKASDTVKLEQGLDPNAVEYKLVPVEKQWIQDYLAFVSKKD